jgi:hypothetical protein
MASGIEYMLAGLMNPCAKMEECGHYRAQETASPEPFGGGRYSEASHFFMRRLYRRRFVHIEYLWCSAHILRADCNWTRLAAKLCRFKECAMANRNKGQRSRNGRKSRQPAIIVAFIVVLAAATLAAAALVAIPLWTAVVQSWRFQPVIGECKTLQDAGARKACYDDQSH